MLTILQRQILGAVNASGGLSRTELAQLSGMSKAAIGGEETAGAFNGAEWLTKNRRELIDAGYALNEGAGGELNAAGKRVSMTVQAGEKVAQNYRLEVVNRVGHTLD